MSNKGHCRRSSDAIVQTCGTSTKTIKTTIKNLCSLPDKTPNYLILMEESLLDTFGRTFDVILQTSRTSTRIEQKVCGLWRYVAGLVTNHPSDSDEGNSCSTYSELLPMLSRHPEHYFDISEISTWFLLNQLFTK